MLIRHHRGVSVLAVEPGALQEVLEAIDGRRSVVEICRMVTGKDRPAKLRRVLSDLVGDVLEVVGEPRGGGKESRILWIANGDFGHDLASRLGGVAASESVDSENIRDSEMVVAVLEDGVRQRFFDVQRLALEAHRSCLFVAADPDGVRIGPMVVPLAGPCFACAQLAQTRFLRRPSKDLFPRLASLPNLPIPSLFGDSVREKVEHEIRAVFAANRAPSLLASILHVGDQGARRIAVERLEDCPLCAAHSEGPPRGRVDLWRQALEQQAVDAGRQTRRAENSSSNGLVRHVGILGGGTAGYLTALALRRHHPELQVALIEAPDVPIIGVGEATTPLMPQFLHRDLGLPAAELLREVQPTFKLGIRFAWGPEGSGTFNYPFGPVRVLEPYLEDGNLLRCSFQSMLMSDERLPRIRAAQELEVEHDLPIAYHLDNEHFVRYLHAKAKQIGVRLIGAHIVDVELEADGERVAALVARDGRRLAFDFYVDASGFRSLLLEKALGSRFVDFASSLPADRAAVFRVPHGGHIKPYTLAEAMPAGWCWNTPQRDNDHRGYVFSSNFASDAEALEHLRTRYPEMSDPRLLSFRAGRHEHFWRGNVVAMGNAYGFVEPLESTALHMLIRQIHLFTDAFPLRRDETGLAAILNRRLAGFWDYLRWFLALHYRFNRRMDSPFWRYCREHVDVSQFEELLVAYRDRGPLSYQAALARSFEYPDPLWGAEGIDVILLGQDVECRLPAPGAATPWRHLCALESG